MKANAKKETIYANIIMLAVFFFAFLGTEYLFDNCMMYVTDASGVVRAQNQMLGVSAIGFLLYNWISGFLADKSPWVTGGTGLLAFGVGAGCMGCIILHAGYVQMMIAGGVLFFLLGVLGAGVHYRMAYSVYDRAMLARCVGFAYAGGIFLQFLNNNMIHENHTQAVALCAGAGYLLFVLCTPGRKGSLPCLEQEGGYPIVGQSQEAAVQKDIQYPVYVGIMLIGIVFLQTIVFTTLDNAVTAVHASGDVDIGQWPRLLLALSGIAAGFLYDIRGRRWMHMIMYCVTLLSTICVIVIGFGGPFLLGLLVFYLSAGFFSIYFTVGFMDISYHSAKPKLWAGLGRAVNNVCALMIMTLAGGFASVRYEVMIVAVILFFLISVLAFSYQNILIGMELRSMEATASALMPQTGGTAEAENKQTGGAAKPEDKQTDLSTTDKFTAFGEQYSLTEREREVLRALLSSGENVQDIAHTLGISRAAIYRHISNMNEKTETKARMGLIQFYYGWNPEK